MGKRLASTRILILSFSFLVYFYLLYLIREMQKLDKFVLSSIGFIILLAVAMWASSAFIKKENYDSYNVRGHWFRDKRGKNW